MELFLQDLVNGILAGGILALVALGFSLVWGIMNIINLAHGSYIMLGAYLTWELFQRAHIDPIASVPIAFAVMFVFGYVIQRVVINNVVRAPILATFLLTFGISLIIETLAVLYWKGDARGVQVWYSGANFSIGAVTIPWAKLLTLVAALAITGLMYLWLHRSRLGRAIRATAMDVGAAQLAGVRVPHIYGITYGLGAALAGAAGALLTLSFPLTPGMGQPFLIKGFVVCVLGGLGSVEGALVGGLVYGVVSSFATRFDVTIAGQHLSGTGLQDVLALLVLLLVLIFRPRGIVGRVTI
jgi:branched-chain amino acid transport system permease protein